SPLPRRSRPMRSAADTFRRPTRNTFSPSAATTASWCHTRSRCRACSRSRCRRRCRAAVCRSNEEIAELAKLLNGARRVTIFGGAGCAGAHAELMEVARRLNAPVVHSLRGKEFIEYEKPFDVGLTGLLGCSSGYHAMMACDVLLMIGCDFPYQQFFPPDATIVQIDVRGEQLGRRTKVDLGLVGDTKPTRRCLLPKLTPQQDDRHLKAARHHYAKTRKGLDELAVV